tara:strand:+ start:235 stop:585 length:351 start_codon:yes stop_codon:yes gene_type:complete
MATEHPIRFGSKCLTLYFDNHGRYVRVKADDACGGHIYGVTWPGGGAVIKEGQNGHPIWDLKKDNVKKLTKKNVKVTRLPNACKVFGNGTPRAYAPNSIHDSVAVFLRDRPLSAMG